MKRSLARSRTACDRVDVVGEGTGEGSFDASTLPSPSLRAPPAMGLGQLYLIVFNFALAAGWAAVLVPLLTALFAPDESPNCESRTVPPPDVAWAAGPRLAAAPRDITRRGLVYQRYRVSPLRYHPGGFPVPPVCWSDPPALHERRPVRRGRVAAEDLPDSGRARGHPLDGPPHTVRVVARSMLPMLAGQC